jgi:hypothetical protein
MSGPKLTDEDQAAVDQMLANREKARERYAEQGGPKSLPADSPIHKKWASDPFPGSAADDEDELAWQFSELQSPDARSRAYILRTIAANPVANEQLLIAAERLLDDRTITLLDIPERFGEVRWLAADAVAALRGALGRSDAVTLEDTFEPIEDVERLAREAGIDPSRSEGLAGRIETLLQMAVAKKLARVVITRAPGAR